VLLECLGRRRIPVGMQDADRRSFGHICNRGVRNPWSMTRRRGVQYAARAWVGKKHGEWQEYSITLPIAIGPLSSWRIKKIEPDHHQHSAG
jgi:hypothetical protein